MNPLSFPLKNEGLTMSLTPECRQEIDEVFGVRAGGVIIEEFAKLDSMSGGVGTVESPNTVLAGPASGVTAAASAFRAIVTADLPAALSPTTLTVSGHSGFYGTAAVVQPTAGHVTTLTGAGSTDEVFANSTFTGGTGSSAYTVGDIVLALKQLGLIAS